MSGRSVSIRVTVRVAVRPAEVFDFTQDYALRPAWDASVLEAEVLVRSPLPRVRVRAAGGLRAVFQYKRFERPTRTSLALEELSSFLVRGGGGSWVYEGEGEGEGTRWTQTNSLRLRPGWLGALCAPLVRWQLARSTRRAMERARELLERGAR